MRLAHKLAQMADNKLIKRYARYVETRKPLIFNKLQIFTDFTDKFQMREAHKFHTRPTKNERGTQRAPLPFLFAALAVPFGFCFSFIFYFSDSGVIGK